MYFRGISLTQQLLFNEVATTWSICVGWYIYHRLEDAILNRRAYRLPT